MRSCPESVTAVSRRRTKDRVREPTARWDPHEFGRLMSEQAMSESAHAVVSSRSRHATGRVSHPNDIPVCVTRFPPFCGGNAHISLVSFQFGKACIGRRESKASRSLCVGETPPTGDTQRDPSLTACVRLLGSFGHLTSEDESSDV